MDASMISLLSTSTSTSFSATDGGSMFGGSSGGGDVFAGDWGFYDDDGRPVQATPSPSFPDTAEGRRARLDDLGAQIAAAQARIGARP
jgi:hypothetical protein